MSRKAIIGNYRSGRELPCRIALEKGLRGSWVVRRSSTETFERISHLQGRITLHQADLLDQLSIIDVFKEGGTG